MRILTRHVLLELLKSFAVSLTAMTVVVLLAGVVREAVNQSLPPAETLRLIPYILPDALRMTVPATLLLATTIVFGRMSGSNEVVAIKALGISPSTVLWPAFVAAFLISLVTVWLNDLAVSWGRDGAQRVIVDAVEEIAYSMLRTKRRYSSSNFAINVKRVEGRRLIRPTLTIRGSGESPTMTVVAEEAELCTNRQKNVLNILLKDSTIDVEGRVTMRLPDTYQQEIPLTDASRAQPGTRSPSWLALRVIPSEIRHHRRQVEELRRELAARATYQMLSGDIAALTGGEWNTRLRALRRAEEHVQRLKTEPHRRWSAGFSCLCFVWVGAPMAIWLRNRDFLTIFFLCFVPILVVYYPLLAWSVDGAKSGSLPPQAVWLGNLAVLVWGAILLRRVMRY